MPEAKDKYDQVQESFSETLIAGEESLKWSLSTFGTLSLASSWTTFRELDSKVSLWAKDIKAALAAKDSLNEWLCSSSQGMDVGYILTDTVVLHARALPSCMPC